MSRSRALVDYAGAGAQGRLTISDVVRFGPRWVAQPKVDGAYAVVTTDTHGRVANVLSRTGRRFPTSIVGHLHGQRVSWPDSTLVGEIEAFTEAGKRAAETRGYAAVHLFDAVRVGGRYLAREPYHVRRDALYRAQSEVVNLGEDRSWTPVKGRRARDRASGRFVKAVPEGWKLMPIVGQVPAARADQLWDSVGTSALEGIVLVNLDAPMARRGAKRKIRPIGTLDATVIKVDCGGCLVYWSGGQRYIALSHRKGVDASVGGVVEIEHNGWTNDGPRFPRLRRARGAAG